MATLAEGTIGSGTELAYVAFLGISGLILVILAALGINHPKVGLRVVSGLIGIAMLVYGGYLFFGDPGEIFIFWYVFVVPIGLIVQLFKARRAAPANQQPTFPAQSGYPTYQPPAPTYPAPQAYPAPQQGGPAPQPYPNPQQQGYPAPQQGGYQAPQQGGYPAPQQAAPQAYPARPGYQTQQAQPGYPAPQPQGQPGPWQTPTQQG